MLDPGPVSVPEPDAPLCQFRQIFFTKVTLCCLVFRRASSEVERQKWVTALELAKAKVKKKLNLYRTPGPSLVTVRIQNVPFRFLIGHTVPFDHLEYHRIEGRRVEQKYKK